MGSSTGGTRFESRGVATHRLARRPHEANAASGKQSITRLTEYARAAIICADSGQVLATFDMDTDKG
jgi:hypothetical protein